MTSIPNAFRDASSTRTKMSFRPPLTRRQALGNVTNSPPIKKSKRRISDNDDQGDFGELIQNENPCHGALHEYWTRIDYSVWSILCELLLDKGMTSIRLTFIRKFLRKLGELVMTLTQGLSVLH